MGGRGKVALAMKCFFKEMRTDLQLQARRSQQMLSIKIVAVGDSKIGKSTLLRNLERKNFKTELPQNPDYIPVVLDEISVQSVTPEGLPCNLSLWDTPGHTGEYGTMRPLHYPNTDIFLVCFSTVDSKSLENVTRQWIPEINYWEPGTPFLLVGTKTDLRQDRETLDSLAEKNESAISLKEGSAAAKEIGAEGYLECSSLTMEGVENVFEKAVVEALKHRKNYDNEKKGKRCLIA